MSCLKARKGNISRDEPLQRARFRNLCEMKRFEDEQKILGKDHRRSTCLINKEIREVQKTLTDIKLISGYYHQAHGAHLRSVSIAFSTFKEYDKTKKLGTIDLNVESEDLVKSDVMFGQRHDIRNAGLFEEDPSDSEIDMSELSFNGIHLTRPKNGTSPHKNLKKDVKNDSFNILELASSEFNRNNNDDAHPQKISRNTKRDLQISSLSPTPFTLHRRAAPVHQNRDLCKCPTPVTTKPSREQGNSKTLSRHVQYQDTKSCARSHESKAAIKRGLDLLIREYNDPRNLNLDLQNKRKTALKDKVSDFLSELSDSKREAPYV